MSALLCIGGEHEGMTLEVETVTHTFEPTAEWEIGERYIKVGIKGEGEFFMLAGLTPADALKRWRELTGAARHA